jgi:histidine triad (HIT) family protein
MQENYCPFCDVDNLEVQSIAENSLMRVYQTYKPLSRPHVLIMPVRHVSFMEELTETESAALTKALQAVVMAGKEAYDLVGYNLWVNGGPKAGQEVQHFHMHFLGCLRNAQGGAKKIMGDYLLDQSPQLDKHAVSLLVREFAPILKKYFE